MNEKNLKPFVKGDPRINRKGRPANFDAWRALLVTIADEAAVQRSKDGAIKKLVLIQIPLMQKGQPVFDELGEPVFIDHYATNAEMMARQMMSEPKHRREFIEGAFGKVPDQVDITSAGKRVKNVTVIEIIKSEAPIE